MHYLYDNLSNIQLTDLNGYQHVFSVQLASEYLLGYFVCYEGKKLMCIHYINDMNSGLVWDSLG